MSFPRYPAYKNSGIEWIGEIPVGWKIVSLKDVLSVTNGFPFDSKNFSLDKGSPLVRIRDINSECTELHYDGDIIQSALIDSSDILIGMDGDFNVGRWRGNGYALLNQRVCCVRGKSYIRNYIEYVLPLPLKIINDVTYSTTVKHLSSKTVENIRLAVPEEIIEQKAIANFLDRECGKIDALIAEQERLIALLAEKRQAVISHAVTKGLNPNAPMKDSGIPWIGMVPEGWEITKIKRICSLVTGITPPSNDVENYSEDGFPWINPADLQEIERPSFAHKYLSQKGKEYIRILPENSILVCCIGTIGKFGYIDSIASTNQQITSLISEDMICSQFLLYLVAALREAMENAATGNVLKILNSERLGNIDVSIPSFDVQQKISFFIQKECQKISSLEKEVEASIVLLKERRAALISAAVTGKIDVRAQSKALTA